MAEEFSARVMAFEAWAEDPRRIESAGVLEGACLARELLAEVNRLRGHVPDSAVPSLVPADAPAYHAAYCTTFDKWWADPGTHYIGTMDAAWQAWMYLHDYGLSVPAPGASPVSR